MKYLIVLIILLLPTAALATNATWAVDPAPAGDACNGFFLGEVAPQHNLYCETYTETGDLVDQMEIFPQHNLYSITITESGQLLQLTNAHYPVGAAPEGNQLNGFFIGTLEPQHNLYCAIYTETGDLVGTLELLPQHNLYSITVTESGQLIQTTNAVILADTPPDGNAADGAFVESLNPQDGLFCYSATETGGRPYWAQDQTWAQGQYWQGESEGLEFLSRPTTQLRIIIINEQ